MDLNLDKCPYTGFSFGGVLAQMLAGKLWLLPQTNTEQLMSSVICITFGQPLIHSDLLMNVVEIYPDFRNNVHAICSSNDTFPLLIETLDPLISANKVYGSILLYYNTVFSPAYLMDRGPLSLQC